MTYYIDMHANQDIYMLLFYVYNILAFIITYEGRFGFYKGSLSVIEHCKLHHHLEYIDLLDKT